MLYGIHVAATLNADLIIEKGNNTYVCMFNPRKVDRSANALPLEEQHVWQITCYRNSAIVDGQTAINKTQTLYPYGINDYKYAITDIDSIDFTYRL